MTSYQDLPSRQKSQRIFNRMKQQQQQQGHQREKFQPYKSRPKTISNIHELLPGLNDISDAFEALPLDIIKYFTLLKEIDAKCINTVPQINHHIKTYIDSLHSDNTENPSTSYNRLNLIKDKINEIIPCLEEKMHVTSVASDLLAKHMMRIDQDYKLIVHNNEIPESIRIGPLNHPAMIMDSSGGSGVGSGAVDRSVPSQRSESRREALAAKKANKETDEDVRGSNVSTTVNNGHSNAGRKKKNKEGTPQVQPSHPVNNSVVPPGNPSNNPRINSASSNASTGSLSHTSLSTSNTTNKKRGRGSDDRSLTPSNNNPSKRGKSKKNEYDDDEVDAKSSSQTKDSRGNEPTYCYCNQVSFGEMVGCDGDDCKREWFHLPCIGFKNPPKGKWYCDDCLVKMKKAKK
ncbi:Transcriptional regulatory protein PHO23 [Spathaspora sp. JA1]|nr:Transcriptional regulatory protein PHO23 [Spathaspora sp. JA1]